MQFKQKFPFIVPVAAILMTACTSNSISNLIIPEQSDYTCHLESNTYMHHKDNGIQFTNNCKSCLAVIFEFQSGESAEIQSSACYVPAESKVFFSQADSYHIVQEFLCDTLDNMKTDSSKQLKAELINNYHSGKCDIFATFAD